MSENAGHSGSESQRSHRSGRKEGHVSSGEGSGNVTARTNQNAYAAEAAIQPSRPLSHEERVQFVAAVGIRCVNGVDRGISGTAMFNAERGESRHSLMGIILSMVLEKTLLPAADEYTLFGVADGKKVPFTNNEACVDFFESCETTYPSVEIFPSQRKQRKRDMQSFEDRRADKMMTLEDENAVLSKDLQKVLKRLDILEKVQGRDSEELKGMITAQHKVAQNAFSKQAEVIETRLKESEGKVRDLQTVVKDTVDNARRIQDEVQKKSEESAQRLKTSEQNMQLAMEELQVEIQKKNISIEDLESLVAKLRQECSDNESGIRRLETKKVDVVPFEDATRNLEAGLNKVSSDLKRGMEKMENDFADTKKEVSEKLKKMAENIYMLEARLRNDMDDTETRWKKKVAHVEEVWELRLQEVKAYWTQMSEEKADVLEVEELDEGLTADLKNCEQGMVVLNSKYDVVKKEFNDFVDAFQSRVKTFEGEVGKRIVESKVDFKLECQKCTESYITAKKCLDTIQKQLCDFMQMNGNHVAVLQHDHQGMKESLLLLDSEKVNLQRNVNKFVVEYQAYVDDMDTWGAGVNKKIVNIVQAMEPTKMEWRVERVANKLKNASDNPIIRSESFKLNSVEGMRLDFFINGVDSKIYQEGVCCVRFYAPKGSRFKYEVYLGRVSEGVKLFDTGNMVGMGKKDPALTDENAVEDGEGGGKIQGQFWSDSFFPAWEGEVVNDSIVISIDITENFNSVASTAKMVKLVTQ